MSTCPRPCASPDFVRSFQSRVYVSPCLCVKVSVCSSDSLLYPCLRVLVPVRLQILCVRFSHVSMFHRVFASKCLCVALIRRCSRVYLSPSLFVSTFCAFDSVKNTVSFKKCHDNKSIFVCLHFRLPFRFLLTDSHEKCDYVHPNPNPRNPNRTLYTHVDTMTHRYDAWVSTYGRG